MTIGHVLLKVAAADHAAVVEFYEQVLKPLGSEILGRLPNGIVAFGSKTPEWFIAPAESTPEPKAHVAFLAPGRARSMTFVLRGEDSG